MSEFRLNKIYNLGNGKVAVFFTRHEPQPRQIEILKSLGIGTIYWVSGTVTSPEDLVKLVTEYNADILIPVLPPTLIAPVLAKLQRMGKEVWTWLMERKEVTEEEAEKLAKEGITVDKDMRSGKIVAFIPKALQKLVRIEVVTEPIWQA